MFGGTRLLELLIKQAGPSSAPPVSSIMAKTQPFSPHLLPAVLFILNRFIDCIKDAFQIALWDASKHQS